MYVCLCRYYKAAKLAEALSKEVHCTVDEKQNSVLITEEGYEGAEEVLGVSHPADASVVMPCVADILVLQTCLVLQTNSLQCTIHITGRHWGLLQARNQQSAVTP